MKYILMVETSLTGAGIQVLSYCLKQNYGVVLLSSNPRKYDELLDKLSEKYPNTRVLISVQEVNTNDYLLLYSKTKEINLERKLDAIFTTSDVHVPQACFLAEQFRTHWLSYDGAATARDKFQMRLALRLKNPDLNPQFCLASNFEEAQSKIQSLHGYPFIAKPRNSNDSIGVVRITCESDLREYFAQYAANVFNLHGVIYPSEVLLESYIDGQEYSIETLHRGDGLPIVLGISQKHDFGGEITLLDTDNIAAGNYTELSLSFPCSNPSVHKLAEQISSTLPEVGVDYGIIHTEFKITSDGQIKILEVNPRLAGDMLGSHCIPFATGIDTAAALVELAIGSIDKVPYIPSKQHGAAIIGIYAKEKGKFDGFANLLEIETFLNEKALDHNILIWKKPGEKVQPPTSNADLLGRIAVEAATVEEALLLCRQAAVMLQITYASAPEIVSHSSLFSPS